MFASAWHNNIGQPIDSNPIHKHTWTSDVVIHQRTTGRFLHADRRRALVTLSASKATEPDECIDRYGTDGRQGEAPAEECRPEWIGIAVVGQRFRVENRHDDNSLWEKARQH